MSSIVIAGDVSGTVTLQAPSAAGSTTLNLPSKSGNLVVSPVSVADGGTGVTTTPTNGQIDIGNGTDFTRTTLTAGSNITITNGAGSITIASTGGGSSAITVNTTTITGGTTGRVLYDNAGTVGEYITIPVAQGGTGATTASAALNALGGVSTGKAIAMAIVFGG